MGTSLKILLSSQISPINLISLTTPPKLLWLASTPATTLSLTLLLMPMLLFKIFNLLYSPAVVPLLVTLSKISLMISMLVISHGGQTPKLGFWFSLTVSVATASLPLKLTSLLLKAMVNQLSISCLSVSAEVSTSTKSLPSLPTQAMHSLSLDTTNSTPSKKPWVLPHAYHKQKTTFSTS